MEDVFDPQIHLADHGTPSTFTLADLGIKEQPDSTPIAGSHPFPFLSHEGVLAYRRSIFAPDVVEACGRSTGAGAIIMRNVASKSKFVSDLWSHPQTTALVSKTLGVDLEVMMPMEMGHTNVQITGDSSDLQHLRGPPTMEKTPLTEEQKAYNPLSSGSVIPWHYDSYPYVCIVMLSDTECMVGGHTYLRRGDGAPQKVEGPSLGTAVVLQGGQIEHLAARAFGSSERITTITSYRVATTGKWDNSFISNIRPYDRLDDLYRQWTLSRLKKMSLEIQAMSTSLEQNQPFPDNDVEVFLEHLSDYSKRTARQMVSPRITTSVATKFSPTASHKAIGYWERIRAVPDIRYHILDATKRTETEMPEMQKYLLDWNETKVKIQLGLPETSQQGPFSWDRKREYYFGDELVRQGLKEVLHEWLDKGGLLRFAQMPA